MKKLSALLAASALVLLTACGARFNGTYTSVLPKGAEGMIALEFESRDKVILVVNGTKTEVDYTVDGKRLKLVGKNGENQIFDIQDDGSLTSGSAMFGSLVLEKQP